MKLEAPKDKSRATASINWITRQLKGDNLQNVSLRAYWPKRISMTVAPLTEAIENPSILIPSGTNEMPTYLEIIRVVDLAARFKGAKTFVEESSKEFQKFYQDVGQQLSKWVAKAPKVKYSESIGPAIPTIFSTPNEVILTENNENSSIFQAEPSPLIELTLQLHKVHR